MTYSNSGTADTSFKILIKAYSKSCGLSKDSTFITVAPNLINSIFNVKTPGCLDSLFYFTNSSKDSIVSWNFGDGKYSTAQNTTHRYAKVGYYTVKVAFKASFGCKDTGTKNIRVIVKPKIGLKYSIDSSLCNTNYLILNVLNYDAVNSYTWNVGSKWSSNKISDTVKIPQQFINFQIPIKLSSRNICGTDTLIDSAFIAIGFKADIVINGLTKGCSPFTPSFDNHSTGRVSSYKVYYGNGDSSINSIKKVTYYNSTDSTISYRVILKAYNPICGYRSDTTYVFLRPNKVKPIGQYSNAVFCDKEAVTFINKSSPEAMVELQWGDGITAFNLKYNDTIKHVYSKPGSYTTTLIAESCGVDTSKKYGIIIDKIPEVDFITIPKSLCAGQPILFTKISDSSFTNRWRVNGSDTANKLDSFTKIFNKPGIYKIELMVYSMLNNCPNSLTKDIKIEPEPTLNFSLDYLFGCVPLKLCGHAKGNFEFLNIDWGNGMGGSKLDSCNTYSTADTFTVSVKATTFNGCSINQNSNVIVLPKPDAKYFVKIDSMPCSSIRIYGKITDPHPINKYTWTFNTNTVLGDTFNFNKQKEMDRKSEILNLTVSNQCGSKSFTDLISIPPDWKAILSVNGVNNGCDPFDAKFFNYTKGKVDSFTVDYGNGKKSINKITDMTYINKTGGTIIFPVVLTIFNKICPPISDTTFITVYPNKIKLGEEHSRTKYCDGEEIFFINRSSPGAKVTFHFGDGVSVTKIYTYGDTVKHFYTKPGKYNISAVTKNPCFGDSVNLFTVDILEKPAINFSANYEPICEDFPVTFTNYTTNATNIIWVIDGLDTIRQQNQFDYKFKLIGQHSVKLIAESISTSCLNEMTKVIQVIPKPVYNLGLDTPICVGQTVCMSIGGNVKKISIDWNNNKFGSINDTCTTYIKSGYYTVNSLVESNEGCREINSKKINVHKLPTVTIYPDKDLINLDLADSIFLNFNKNQPFKKYTWFYNGDTICDDRNTICDSIKVGPFYYTTLEKFGVMLIDQYGCFATDEINIQIVSAGDYFVPNAFSPNNDGINDIFNPIIYDPEIDSFDIMIFNRWGESLIKDKGVLPNIYSWDGQYQGKPAQMDVYLVIIQFYSKSHKYALYKGLIHLIK
jgi:gliding motility-associated-like protein